MTGRSNARSRRAALRAAGQHPSQLRRFNSGGYAPPTDAQLQTIGELAPRARLATHTSRPMTWAEAEETIRVLRAQVALRERDAAARVDAEIAAMNTSGPATARQREALRNLNRRHGIRAMLPANLTFDEASRRIEHLTQHAAPEAP